VAKRRRYDTVALVSEIKRERRNAMLWGLAATAVLVGVLAIIFVIQTSDPVPAAPAPEAHPAMADTTPQPAANEPARIEPATTTSATTPTPIPAVAVANAAAEPAAAAEPVAAAEPAAAEVKPATVQISAPKKAVVIIDGKPFKGRKPASLEAGQHMIKVKVGRKTMSQKITVADGGSYELKVGRKKLDFKKKKK
jgi:hypothetical protein